MLITTCDTVLPGQNRILLYGSREQAVASGWGDAQFEYLDACFERKQKVAVINQYGHMDVVVIPEEGRSGYKLAESHRLTGVEIHELAVREKWKDAVLIDNSGDPEHVGALVEGLALSNYQFLKYLSKPEIKRHTFKNLAVLNGSENQIRMLNSVVESVAVARDLVNEPASFLNAPALAMEIERISHQAGIEVEIFDKARIESLKMGGILAVNRGSVDPPRFIILKWEPEMAVNEAPVVLVGKGITFDTGGLSIKPTPGSMDEMKSDMAGAAAVTGILLALARIGWPVRTIGLIPATDNRPDGNAYAPGDIIHLHDGTSVEILNCDAEGRLILADALSYAKKYNPELVIDLATLTGSAQVALGPLASAVMGTASDEVFSLLEEAGFTTHERVVRFPLWEDYGKLLESEIADVKNIGGRYAGAITAGKFLERFTGYPWIHLDIAGTAFLTARESYRGIGGTGTGVRLIIEFLRKLYLENKGKNG
jgi:leucyl aminopeptidase